MLHERFGLPEYSPFLGQTNINPQLFGGEMMVLLSLALISPQLGAALSFGTPETIAVLTRWKDHKGDQQDGVGEEAEGLRFVQLGEET